MRTLLTALGAFFCLQVLAQKPDTLGSSVPDTLRPSTLVDDSLSLQKSHKTGLVDRFFRKKYPNPRTAAFLSLVLPGAGQAYNKKWWKVPIAWGALAGIGYGTFSTQKTYHDLRDAYKTKVNGGVPESPYNTFDATLLKSYRDTFRGYTEKWYIALGATYLLVVTDAFVDAQLAHFDVSDDLTLHFKPSLESTSGLPALGLGLAFNFHSGANQIQNAKFLLLP